MTTRTRKLLATHEVEWLFEDDSLEFRVEIFEQKSDHQSVLVGRVLRCDAYRVKPVWPQQDKSGLASATERWFVLDGMFDSVVLGSDNMDSALEEILGLMRQQFEAPTR